MSLNKLILLSVIILCGCNTLPRAPTTIIKQIDPIRVEIPIVQKCVSEDIPLPELYMAKITDEDIKDPGKVVQYYAVDITQLKSVILRQKVLLDACREGKTPPDITPLSGPLPDKPITTSTPIVEKPKTNTTKPLEPSGRTFAPPPPP